MLGKKSRGFGLFKLLATSALFTLVLSIGFPLIYSLLQFKRLETAYSLFSEAVVEARIQAVTHKRPTEICKSVDGVTCSFSNRWEEGFIVYVDTNRDGMPSSGEPIVKQVASIPGRATIRSVGSQVHSITYLPNGSVNNKVVFDICLENSPEFGRSLEIERAGGAYAGVTTGCSAPSYQMAGL